ncbi:MAG TPA: hypothetical protein PKC80_09000 [Burkholderiaceae bacterium]|nr:hypothetical protein [Burkholderiaceae bacterium]
MNSYPMMKTRFDIWYHLGYIDDYVYDPNVLHGRSNWYKTWAHILRLLETRDISTYAVIIHRTQFLISCFSIYLSAKFLLPALLHKTEQNKRTSAENKLWVSSFALSSMMVWLTVIGTVSTFQQAWIMWYSVNYQITLPFLFLAISLLINAVATQQSHRLVFVKIAFSLFLLTLVLFWHAGELVYLFVYLLTALFLYANKQNIKKIFAILLLLLIVILIASQFYNDRIPEIFTLIKTGQGGKIAGLIHEYGQYNIEGGNRFAANWNALYAICVVSAIPVLFFSFYDKSLLNTKSLYIVLASLIYCFVPTFKLSSGIASLFYVAPIVNRFYFASMLFALPSLLAYLALNKSTKFNKPIYLLILIAGLMVLTAAYSRYVNDSGTYFQNIHSIRNSLKPEKVGIDIPAAEILSIKAQIDEANMKYKDEDIMFCANHDKSHIIQYVYRQKNILFDRFIPHEIADCKSNPKAVGKKIVYID